MLNIKLNKRLMSFLIPLLVAALAVSSIAVAGKISRSQSDSTPSFNEGSTTQPAQTDEAGDAEVKIVAAGNNLIHMPIIESGMAEDGTLSYDYMYENIMPYIQSADLAAINQETVLGGDSFDYSGYPTFNSPWEIGEAAINAGFDVFTCATDHRMDMGAAGIEKELEFFSKHPEVIHIGTNLSQEEYDKITYTEVNGITFALLNYTFGTNGITVPEDKTYLINMLDESKVTSDVEQARKNADAVIVFANWGNENSSDINEQQQTYTKLFSKLGVDIVIGTHPNVLQSVEWVTNDETGKKMLVYYSLGNFISHHINLKQMCGGLAQITVARKDGSIEITDAKLLPVVDYYTKSGDGYKFSVYALKDYTDELAASQAQTGADKAYFEELVKQTVSEEFID